MHRLCLIAFFVTASVARADDIYLKSKEKKTVGVVKQETGLGVLVGTSKDVLPADDIIDIEYEIEPVTVRTTIYRTAVLAEKDSLDPSKESKRKELLKTALEKYEESLKKLGPGQEFARRNLAYKVATLSLRQAHEDGGPIDVALARLNDFRTRYPDSWQITRCTRLLAQLELDAKKFKEAESLYKELAKRNVAQDVKQEAEVLAAQAVLAAGDHQGAEAALNALLKKLPKNSRNATRARIAQAECWIAAKKAPEGMKAIRQIIAGTGDKTLKAVAYNALGKALFEANQLKAARWEFLWVDAIYNEDRVEHAKALYYLWKVFDKLGEADRAVECRETLLGDRQLADSEWYRRAKLESARAQ